MSAAWVERTARDPILQHLISRGLQELGEPAFDIADHLERMDLAQRQQIISDIAVGEQQVARRDAIRAEQAEINRQMAEVDAQTAEVHRQIADLLPEQLEHVNDHFPAGG